MFMRDENRSNASPPLIEFDGPWTILEKQRVRGMVCSVEAEHHPPLPLREVGPVWVATKSAPISSSALVVYAISRGNVEIMASTSLEQLVRYLRQAECTVGAVAS
jgi:hypothetical protein